LAAFHCSACTRDFEAEEGRCPKCLRKSTVREVEAEPGEVEALAAGEDTPSERPGLHLALIALSLVVSLAVLGLYLSSYETLTVLRGEWPAGIGLLLGSIVSVRIAPRFAVEEPRPLVTYALLMGLAFVVGTTVTVAGLLATWTLADVSIVLAVVVAIALWLSVAIPVFHYGVRMMAGREGAPPPRTTGKWR
jgi:hypothetical protein